MRRLIRSTWPAGLLLIAAVLEPVLGVRLGGTGARVDAVLVAVAACALFRGPEAGAIWGFLGGLLQDLLSGHALGLEAGIKTVLGFLLGLLTDAVLLEGSALPFVAAAVATAAWAALAWGLGALLSVPLGPASWEGLARTACYNGAVAPLAFWIIRHGERRLRRTDAAPRRGSP